MSGHAKPLFSGPPGQVAAVAGPKAGGQGELGGILKELGYVADQVNNILYTIRSDEYSSLNQVYKF
jgi:hypothetical protein